MIKIIKRKSLELDPGTPIRRSKSNTAKKNTIKTNEAGNGWSNGFRSWGF